MDDAMPQISPYEKTTLATIDDVVAKASDDGLTFKRNHLGVAFKDLTISGVISESDYCHTVADAPLVVVQLLRKLLGREPERSVNILQDVEGVIRSGQMLAVLGRPGSGCSTLLKTLAGDVGGLSVGRTSFISYEGNNPMSLLLFERLTNPKGVSQRDIRRKFRRECIYTAEHDVHFPELTIGETLAFASATQFPKHSSSAEAKTEFALNVFNLAGSADTKIGNEIIRGISGGEKKRVTIAEALSGEASLQCWDNSTRGMDSGTALKVIKHFRSLSKNQGTTMVVSLYQASQEALDEFDLVTVLYQGRQIYFGPWDAGLAYFHSLGFRKPPKMTAGDFFTAVTNPAEARNLAQEGKEDTVPRTAEEFVFQWALSEDRMRLLGEIQAFQDEFPSGRATLNALRDMKLKSRGADS